MRKFFSKIFRRRRPFRLTKAGWIFILYTVGIGAGSINTGNNLLYLIFGIFLGVIMASGFLSDFSLWKVEAKLGLPSHLAATQANFLSLELINRKRFVPALSTTVEIEGFLHGQPVSVQKYIPLLLPNEKITSHVIFIPPTRGWFQITQIKLATRFPFGLLYKWWTVWRANDATQGAVVFPSLLDPNAPEMGSAKLGEENPSRKNKKGEGILPFYLRPFQEGDNPRRIHWKASARQTALSRSGESSWLVREMEAEEENEIWLRWVTRAEFQNLTPTHQEKLIQVAASLVHQFSTQGKEVWLLVPQDGDSDKKMWQVIQPIGLRERYLANMTFLSLYGLKNEGASAPVVVLQPLAPGLSATGRDISIDAA